MELLLIIVAITIIIINENKENQKILCYDTRTGRPIFEKDVIIIGYDEKTGIPLYEYKKKIIGYNTHTGYPIFEEDKELNKSKLSNTILMITGAFLVIFASVIFLKSAWYDIPSILKSAALIIIQLIFLFFSKICQDKLDIPKVSKLFKYISYGFIPVILLSGAYFEVFGEFFSRTGEGYSLYAGISFIIADIVYKFTAKKDNVLKTASYLAEVIGLIFIGYMISQEFIFSILLVAIQTIIMYILLHGNYLDKKAYEQPYNIIIIILIISSILNNLSTSHVVSYVNLFIISAFCFINYTFFSEENKKIQHLSFFLLTYLPTFRLIGSSFELMNFLYYILSVPIIFILKGKENTYKNTFRVLFAIFSILFVLESFTTTKDSILPIINYIVAFIFYISSYIFLNEPIYKTTGYIILTIILIEIIKIMSLFNIMIYIPIITAILLIAIEMIFKKIKDRTSHTYIFTLLVLQTIFLHTEITFVIPLVLIIFYIIINKLNEELIFIPMLLAMNIFSLDNSIFIPIISIILCISYTILSVYKKTFNIYTIFSLIQIVATYTYFKVDISILFIICVIFGILHLIFSKEKKYIYKILITLNSLGLYYRILTLASVPFTSMYIFGLYVTSIIISRIIFDFEKEKIDFLELISFIVLTLFGIIASQDLVDGLMLIAILVLLAIVSYSKKYKYYAYGSLIGLIACIILQTISYWSLIPWYVYILIIGLVLISYAIYDENKKQKKRIEDNKKEKDM